MRPSLSRFCGPRGPAYGPGGEFRWINGLFRKRDHGTNGTATHTHYARVCAKQLRIQHATPRARIYLYFLVPLVPWSRYI